MKYLKIIGGVIVLVALLILGTYLFQHKAIVAQPGKDKFSIDATIKSIDQTKKSLVVQVSKANVTLQNKVDKEITLEFSSEGVIKGTDGKVIQLADLKPATKVEIKGTISNGQYSAEYIVEE